MVGNDLNEDMAAGELGMKTYLVKDYLSGQGRGCCLPDREGSLQDLYELIRDQKTLEFGCQPICKQKRQNRGGINMAKCYFCPEKGHRKLRAVFCAGLRPA